MTTIERYIFRRILTTSLGAFAAILAVVWVTQALQRIDFATGTGGAAAAFLYMMVMLIPHFITITLPFGLLLGAMIVLNAMNADSEMPVVASSGVGRLALARPLLILGGSMGILILFLSHFVEPLGNREVRDVVTQARTDLLATLIVPGRFNSIDDGLTVYIERKIDGEVLGGIMIADRRNEDQNLLYHARLGTIDDSTDSPVLVLNDGEIHRQDTSTGELSIIRFQSYGLSLAQFSGGGGSSPYRLEEQPTSFMLDPDPNDRFVQTWPGQVQGELHARFTDWLFAPLTAMIALAFAGQPRSHRTGGVTTIIAALGMALVLKWASYFSYNEIRHAGSLFWLLYLIPLAGIGVSAYFYVSGRSIAVPDWLGIRLAGLRRSAGAGLSSVFKRRVA